MFPELLLARAVMGTREACYLPAALALIADLHPERTRSFATGLHQSGLYGGMALGGGLGGWMGQLQGWRAPFVHASKPFFRAFVASLADVLRLPGFLGMLIAFSAFAVANWVVYTWLPLYIFERFGMSLAASGFSATFYLQTSSFVDIFVGGWTADCWSRTLAKDQSFTQALGLGIAAPFLFIVGIAGSAMILVTSLVAFGIGAPLVMAFLIWWEQWVAVQWLLSLEYLSQ